MEFSINSLFKHFTSGHAVDLPNSVRLYKAHLKTHNLIASIYLISTFLKNDKYYFKTLMV